jgi:hypothetical protein
VDGRHKAGHDTWGAGLGLPAMTVKPRTAMTVSAEMTWQSPSPAQPLTLDTYKPCPVARLPAYSAADSSPASGA